MRSVVSAVVHAVSVLAASSSRFKRTQYPPIEELRDTRKRLAELYCGQGVSTDERALLHRFWLQCSEEIERLEKL